MKHLFTVFCLVLALLFIQQEAFAQPKHGFTVRALWYNYENPEPEWENWDDIFETEGRGIELAYNRALDDHATLVVPVKLGTARKSSERNNGIPGRNELLANLDAQMQYSLLKRGRLINPYAALGVGTTWNVDDEHFDFNIPASLGLNIRLAKNLYANAQTQYRFSLEDRPGWHHGIGGTVFFGDDEEPAPPSDRDADGILDITDACPDIPGVPALNGCPDRDGDGVGDADDKCPDVAGVAALMGCPDRDSDGITDAEDTCPDLAGVAAFKGCPDTDGDGIPDNLDKCPREAGTAALQGCPVRDRDGDGIADADDRCPDQYGGSALRGCPDSDGDGVADGDDRCPDKAGPASNKGCPEIKAEDKAKLERAVKLVQFQTGKSTLLASSYKVLDEVVSVMNQYPEYSLNISGHTDSSGDDKMNQELSERRAKSCYEYLISKGVNAARIEYAGYGETKPRATNATAAGREQNRRVEFELYVK